MFILFLGNEGDEVMRFCVSKTHSGLGCSIRFCILIVLVAFVLVASLLTACVHAHPLYFPLSEHTMTTEVSSSGVPQSRTYTFTQDDAEAVCWLKVWRDQRAHTVEWRWYSPNMRVYKRSFGVIPAIDGPAGMWGSCIWSGLRIKGEDVANLPGTWKVDVIVDFRKVLTEYFTIGGNQAPCC